MTGPGTPEHAVQQHRLEARRAQAMADIDAVEAQVEAGELDRKTADTLIDRYRREATTASHDLADSIDDPVSPTASRTRTWIGAGLLIGAFAVAAVLAAQAIRPREGGFITGGPENAVNLEEVTNEQMEAVIAANPGIPEVARMQVALANRYFDDGEFSSAVGHYLDSLTGQLGASDRAQALGRVGWMTYLSGRAELGQQYVEESLLTDSGYAEGVFFLGLIHLYGNDDPAAAIPLLEDVEARDDLPPEIRDQVEAALEDARSTP